MNGFTEKITDKAFIGKLIPQKFPFVMVDKLLHFEEKKVISGLTISENNIFTQNQRFAASGLIENMAQTVALYTGYQYFLKNEVAPTGYIGAIKKALIFELPEVGDELRTTAVILHDIMDVTLVATKIECEDRLVAESEMKTVLANL